MFLELAAVGNLSSPEFSPDGLAGSRSLELPYGVYLNGDTAAENKKGSYRSQYVNEET